ncbi:BgTH12-05195 [Blumeria graminis f. sp. triticale]|uniref:BgTH12-05195 n=1 Tax=Blumeria graminis f. sp. triticale TaxID=1689686 RepID=A0A9W4DIX7_BLUGR|nr:BgTH12-05195 [Blumeria graminis f. sp. triticale]
MENYIRSGGNLHESQMSDIPPHFLPAVEIDTEFPPALPTFDRLADPQESLPTINEPSATLQRNSPLDSASNDQLLDTPPPSNLIQTAQEFPILSSDYGDIFEYEDLFDASPPPSEFFSRGLPVTLDDTELPSIQSLQETSKRPADSSNKTRPTKLVRTTSPKKVKSLSESLDQDEIDTVDLRNIETELQWEEKKKRDAAAIMAKEQSQENKPKLVKLSDFQCIICMDSPTDLTVTHCGHLFCSECLHQALYAGEKKCCPVCRTTIHLPKTGARQGKNGIFALEMKLMTSKKKGKQSFSSQLNSV